MKFGRRIPAPALLLAGAFLFARGVHAQSADSREAAFFRELSGTVETRAPGSDTWVSAVAGDRIEKDTVISTGFKSSAVILLGNSVVMVQPVSRLTLEEIIRNRDGEQINLYLQTGRIRAEVRPPAGERTGFTVRSPIATASVRGTSFEFDTENIRVGEGRVQYSLANGRQTGVASGETSYVDEINNTVISPFKAAAELLTPALPPGSGSGGPVGVIVPVIPPVLPPFSGADAGIGFIWD